MKLPSIPNSLSEKIQKENIAIFIGAGLSVAAGLPDWKSLTIAILEGLKDREPRANGFVDALNNNLFEPIDILNKIQPLKSFAIELFEKEIRKYDKVQPTSMHSKVSKISSRIITTNYDDLLEESNPDFEKVAYNNTYKVSKISDYDKSIFKIHGDISEPDKCILFPKEYEDLYSHDEKTSIFELKKYFSDKSILFIGFSLSDPYINFIIDYISKLYSGFTPEHYIITTDTNKNWPNRITPIYLQNHTDLEPFLDQLIENKQNSKPEDKFIEVIDDNIKIEFDELEYDIPPNIKFWVGRKREIVNISNENFKVIFITGIGGKGKSALAAQFVKNNFNKEIYEFGDWRDFKEESNRFQTKIISIIKRLTKGEVDARKLEGIDTNELVDTFFKYLDNRHIVFVFDNVDSYIDLENFVPIGGIGYLFNQALARSHNSRFIFTCRPFIKEASVNFYQISLSGLLFDESLELFKSYDITANALQLEQFTRKAHTLTKGHPLWLNLIAAQTIRGIETATNFIDGLENKTNFNEEDFSSIMSQKVLNQVWNSLNDKQQTLLRSIAETVKPETINNLKQIVDAVLNNNQFDKALRTLKNLNLVETKSSSITEDQIELHPLVKEFILTKFQKRERLKFITLLVKYYDSYIYILKPKLSSILSLQSFLNWTSKIELEINKGDFKVALIALEEVSSPIISAGFTEEYIRVAERLFDTIDWNTAIDQEYPYFHNQLTSMTQVSTQLGKFAKTDLVLEKYEKLIPGKSDFYLNFCSAKCYLYWYQESFETAILYGEKGEFLLSGSGLADAHSLKHNLALARRDSRDLPRVEQALNYFLGGMQLDDLFNPETNRSIGSTYFGNIGRCLEFKGDLKNSLNCYIKSLVQIFKEENDKDSKLNVGYASYWISGVLIVENNINDGLLFLKLAIFSWDNVSPPRANKLREKWDAIDCDIQLKSQIDGLADWQVEKQCKQLLYDYSS